MSKTYKHMHFQGMGSFNWFKIAGWQKEDREQAIQDADDLIRTIKEHGYPDHSAVMWLCDGERDHRNLNRKTPWTCYKDGCELVFDLKIWDRTFWKLYKIWLEIHKKYHLKFVPIYMMREDYCDYPFIHNINNVHGINTPKAMKYIKRYVKRATKMYIKIFGKPPSVILYNEPAHYGNGKKYHQIMYDHETLYEDILRPLGVKLNQIWPDLTMCEGSAGELIEPHPCPKPGACDRQGWHGKPGQDRKVLGIKHNFTTLGDFMLKLSNGKTRLQNMVDSANHHRLYTEDGGGTVDDGEYHAGPFGIKCGSAEQQYEMMRVLIDTYERDRFLARFGTFPHEALFYDEEKDLFIPDYRVENINWDRIDRGVLRACREKYD